jgi:signal transduction histidine kinase
MHYGGDLPVRRASTKVEIDLELLTMVTPFVLATDENMVVTWASRAVLKRVQEAVGMNVTELIESGDPPEEISSQLLAKKIGQIRKLTFFQGKSRIPLIGRWLSCHDGFLLLASPDAKTSEDLLFFSFDDFPQESRLVELLVGRDETHISLKEAASAAVVLKEKNKELEKSEGELNQKMREVDEQRRAILNMMKDTEISKRRLESVNAVLESEIAERKRAEETQKKTHQELEKAHSELKGMQSQIVQSEKLASIGQLAAGVAHEMNTPVGFVASNFETLQKYFKKFKTLLEMHAELARQILTEDKAQLTAKLAEINKAATDMKIGFVLEDIGALFEESKEGLTRVTKIVQNLRDFSRIDQAEAFDEYDINHGIEATLTVARNAIKYHADVVTEFADVPHIPCNASQINQVFLNILVNAAQAIESQHRETNGSIRIKTSSDDTHVICKIIDDGPGIPQENIEKIFDPFFTTKPVGQGTGLGLSVSYDIIIRKHKGELLVNSVIGKGTEFTIKLPIRPAPTTEKHDKEIEADATIESSVC